MNGHGHRPGTVAPCSRGKVRLPADKVEQLRAILATQGMDRTAMELRSSPTVLDKALTGMLQPATADRLAMRLDAWAVRA